MSDKSFEEQSIKGITGRLIAWIIISTATLSLSSAGAYFGISYKIDKAMEINEAQDKNINGMQEDNKARDLQLKAFQIQLNTLEFKVNELYRNQANEK